MALFGTTAATADDFFINVESFVQNNGHNIDGNDSLTIGPNGTITTIGTSSVLGLGNNNTVVNNGTLSVTGNGFNGISLINSGTVTNDGLITTNGNNSIGISVFDNNLLNQNGTINVGGASAFGILINNSNIVNIRGIITGTGIGSNGIVANSNNIINHFGSINVSGDAFLLLNNNTLNLRAGSTVIGGFNLGTNTTLNIETGNTRSINWIFNPNQIVGGLANISGPVPAFQNLISPTQLQVTTFNGGSYSASADILAQLTGKLSQTIRNRLSKTDPNRLISETRLSSLHQQRVTNAFETVSHSAKATDQAVWINVMGSNTDFNNFESTPDTELNFNGVNAGIDWSTITGDVLGLTAGFINGKTKTGDGFDIIATEDFSGFYGGFYGKFNSNQWFVNSSVNGGILDHTQTRDISSNNLAATTAIGDYQSRWISPELTIGYQHPLSETWTALPSTTIRYARQHINGYQERGNYTANAAVEDRVVEVTEASLEMALNHATHRQNTTIRAGWFHRRSSGDNTVAITMFGNTQNLAIDNRDHSAAYFAADTNLHLTNRLNLQAGIRLDLGEHIRGIQGDIRLIARF